MQNQAKNQNQHQTVIKPLNPDMANNLSEQLNYLSEHNPGIKNLEYFYHVYQEVYGNRVKELLALKNEGKKIVGVFCNFVPMELIIAADAVPIRLASGFQDPILLAEEILPRNFCPLIKSSYGFSLMNSPHFDLVDLIIIPTTCDGKKKLGEILSERKPTWVIEVPHTNETPQARRLWLTELELLKKQLEQLTGNRITAKKLRDAITLMNKKRAVTRRLYDLRKRTPPSIWGRDAMLVTNLSLYDDVSRWTARTEALCNEINNQKPVVDNSVPRIMITGSPTVFPTWKVPILVEESGGIIVMDDICTGSKELWDPIEAAHWTMNDMLIAIADKYLMNTCACFTPNMVRAERLVQFVKDFKVDGVIYHVLQACHIYGMEQLRIEKALDKINIPILNIETDFSQEDVEQIRTRVEAFLEMVALRKFSGEISSIPTKPAEALIRQLETTNAPVYGQPQVHAQGRAQVPIQAQTHPQARPNPTAIPTAKPASAVSTESQPIIADPIPRVSDPIPKMNDPIPKVNDPIPKVSDPIPKPAQPVSNEPVSTEKKDGTKKMLK